MTAPIYSLDTSGLIDGIERYYPIANFPALWERIDGLIILGRLRISAEAWDESTRLDAPLKDWLTEPGCDRDAAIFDTDLSVGRIAGEIVSGYPSWSKKGGRNGADPFVIAVAELCANGIVITGEKDGGPANPKIPYVCRQRGTPVAGFVDVIKTEGWRFG